MKEKEIERLNKLKEIENDLHEKGMQYVACSRALHRLTVFEDQK